MFITSTSNAYWQPGKISNEKGFELSFGEEQQTIRGFGCCFSELGAKALNKLSPEDKKNVLDELFNSDGGAFNYCRTPIGASDFALDYYSYNDNEGEPTEQEITVTVPVNKVAELPVAVSFRKIPENFDVNTLRYTVEPAVVTLEGGIDEQESELIRSAVEFNDLEAQEILTHRVDIIAISDDEELDSFLFSFQCFHFSFLF